jgi:hypothetical protein
MNTRLAIAVLAALTLPLSATTSRSGAAMPGAQRSQLHVGLRIANPDDAVRAAATPAAYDMAVRHALLESDTPRNIALAALPAKLAPHEDAVAIADLLFGAAARAPDDVLVQWLAANRLLAMHDDARAATAIATLTDLEPDNAAAWALALSLAAARGDHDAVDRSLARMAKSTRSDEHVVDALHAWLAIYEAHPRPLAAFANPVEADAAPFVDAMSKATAAMPSYEALVGACANAPGTHRADDCAAAARVMLHGSTSLSARRVGFALLMNLGAPYVSDADRGARRELAWVAANAGHVSGLAALDRPAIAAHRDDWRSLGDEYEIMQRAMRRAGVPDTAPIGWVPAENPTFARAGAG